MMTNAGEVSAPGPAATLPRPGVWLTEITLFVMATIWGVNVVVLKYATTHVPPIAFNALRVTLAAVALLVIASMRRGPWPSKRQAWLLVGLGVLGNGIYQMFYIEGVAHTRASDAAILIAATPAFIALLSRVRGVERIRSRGWFGIVLSIVGIALVSSVAALSGKSSLIGDLLILCASFCWATYTVFLKPFTHEIDGVKLSAFTMVGGSGVLLMVAAPTIATTAWSAAPVGIWGAMAFSGIGGLVIAYLFWYRGIRIIGPTRTAMFSNIQPIVAVLVAWAVLGEFPTIWQGVGMASIMSGLLLTRS